MYFCAFDAHMCGVARLVMSENGYRVVFASHADGSLSPRKRVKQHPLHGYFQRLTMPYVLEKSQVTKWSRSGSNRRPLACHASALPTELRPHFSFSLNHSQSTAERPISKATACRLRVKPGAWAMQTPLPPSSRLACLDRQMPEHLPSSLAPAIRSPHGPQATPRSLLQASQI